MLMHKRPTHILANGADDMHSMTEQQLIRQPPPLK
jgi:hypothetical protein